MEINLNFVLFDELQEEPDSSRVVARIVVIRESKDTNLAFEGDAAGIDLFE